MFISTAKAILENPNKRLTAALLICVLLYLPSLFGYYYKDDIIQLALLMGIDQQLLPESSDRFFKLFSFYGTFPDSGSASGSGSDSVINNQVVNNRFIETGVFPWWTSSDAYINFFRPITELSHYLDFYLFDAIPFFAHLQSLLWFIGALLILSRLYQRYTASNLVAGLALLIYCVDYSFSFPVSWIANRNAIIALFFMLGSFYFFSRHYQTGFIRYYFYCLILFALGLLSAEFSIGITAYFFAFTLLVDRNSWRNRIIRALPLFLLFFSYLLFYKLMGFGTKNVAFYTNPISEPVTFLIQLFERLPLLFASQFYFLPSEISFNEALKPFHLIASLILIALSFLLFKPILEGNRTNQFWLTGSVLAMALTTMTIPQERVLFFAAIGGNVLIAELIKHYINGVKHWSRYFIRFLVVLHLIISPLLVITLNTSLANLSNQIKSMMMSFNQSIDPQKSIIILNSQSSSFHFPFYRHILGFQPTQSLYQLAATTKPLTVCQLTGDTLSLELSDGIRISDMERDMANHPFRVGDSYAFPELRITIRSVTEDARPQKLEVQFHEPFTKGRYEFYSVNKKDFQRVGMNGECQSI